MSVTVTFLGGAGAIGASCAVVQAGDSRLVVDCGVRFAGSPLPDLAQLGGEKLDAILLTHAHSDHSGGLPVLCEAFPATPVYATPPTIDIVGILLRDALRLMGGAEREGEVPLYSAAQLERLMGAFVPVHHEQPIDVGDVRVTFLPASHILGASMVHLATAEGEVLFTGDYSVAAQLTVPALARPALPVDMVVTESTYGARLHEDRAAAERRLVGQVSEVVDAGGRVLIPAFAVGRAQEVLRILGRALRRGDMPSVSVYVDGMVRRVCDVYTRHERYVSRALLHDMKKAEHAFYHQGIRPIVDAADRRAVLDGDAAVVVASSGMLAGGASMAYAEKLAPRAGDAILITGYQDEESPGAALLRLAASAGEGPRRLRLGANEIDVNCRFDTYGLSAHADRMQMLGLLEGLRPRTVVLVHGDGEAKRTLAKGLRCSDVVLAEDGDVLSRRYPRHRGRRRRRPQPEEADVEALRGVLGPAGDRPVRARRIAEAWFGEQVDAGTVSELAARLEQLGLVRRDDERRAMLWVLGPGDHERFADEAAVEEELKQDNPKGRLLELCMRMRISPPESSFDVEGAFHLAAMTLALRGETLSSGPQRASSKKTAEQLAARQLLRLVAADSDAQTAAPVDEERARQLRADNPKGKLLEHCAGHKLPAPRFEAEADVAGFRVRATGPDGERSGWHLAPAKKVAEQAAAAELLELLRGGGAPAQQHQEIAVEKGETEAVRPSRDARMLLNELRQVGLIGDFDYAVHDREGPSHQPIFVLSAWASLPQGERVESERVHAGSKKDAQRLAAAALVEQLAARGVTG